MLHLIRRHGVLTKAEATRKTGLSANAVSMIFRGLEQDNLLVRDAPLRGRIGQPSVPLRLNPDARHYIGLKIGRRSFDIVVVDFCGAVRARRSGVIDYPTPANTRSFVKAELPRLLRSAGLKRAQVAGTGIAMPTAIWEWLDDFKGATPEMEAWRNFEAGQQLDDVLPGPILVENDATAACRAEWTFGKQSDRPDSIYFFVGTFIGGGIVLNGNVFKGCFGNSGGFGPLRIPDEPGGTRLIDHASLMTLERMLAANGRPAEEWMPSSSDWGALEPVLTDWIARAGRSLAHAIVSTGAVIDFEHVIIDGAFPDAVRTRLRDMVESHLHRLDTQGISVPEILPGSFGGAARAIGAAALHITSRYMVEPDTSLRARD
ncbi:ROK family protein [Halovulum dunhuangense]|uniref:ROK family protein n=1 Tax=Halovulum dunhuangense TaxID=1505036 RepID=UPI00148DA1D7